MNLFKILKIQTKIQSFNQLNFSVIQDTLYFQSL